MLASPATQKAVVIESEGTAVLVSDRSIPNLRDDFVLVRNIAVALNPTDWKHIDWSASPGALVGCDCAGIVEAVGNNLTRPYKKGDRISGGVHGSNALEHQDGAFAEYVLVRSGVSMRIPESISFEQAATFGIGINTVGLALHKALKIPFPGQGGPTGTVLVYGGSTATGSLAIQFAKAVGWTVVTTCSFKNFAMVKERGADEVFDYNDFGCAKKVRVVTGDKLAHILDCVSTDSSADFCNSVMGASGGTYSCLDSVPALARADIRTEISFSYGVLGDPYQMGTETITPSADTYAYGTAFYTLAARLIGEGKIVPHPLTVGEDGLAGVLKGLDELRDEQVRGHKLVYLVADTPE
ncbi:hypothetical protein HDU87_000912 [Geranomyces variabilis]|uniref:Enoyl reductase (ER) domain-containing protein n=1 Tax=Geranomyces variabilis TaxID=109894 RepID=A0AAD5XJ92_9FUNG|nr:hypothetical protein HDU87_000912 [Geranomyces variabilis]